MTMTMTMTPHRRLSSRRRRTTATCTAFAIALFCLASSLRPEWTTPAHAFQVLPSTTRGIGIGSGGPIGLQQQQKIKQNRVGIHLPLRVASTNYDYVRNSNATTGSYDDVDVDVEDEDTRLGRFMVEALAELESFESSSSDRNSDSDSNDINTNDNDNHEELSLLFPEMLSAAVELGAIHHEDGDNVNGIILNDSDNDNDSVNVVSVVVEDQDDSILDEAISRARWLLIAAAALYGTNFSVVKLLGDEMPVGISSSLRFGLAALATLPWLLEGFLPNMNRNTNNDNDNDVGGENNGTIEISDDNKASMVMATMYGLEVGLWNSIGYVAQAVGLETTLASKSAFLCSMAVVIVPLLDWAAGKTLMPRQWVGALMALVGVAFLELGGGDTNELLSSGITNGDALSMVQPFMFGLGFWRMEQAMQQFPQEARRMTAAQLMAIFASSAVYGAWTLGVFDHFVAGGFESLPATINSISTSFPWKEWFTDPSILFSLFWTGCITTALTIYMETLALESLSAAETTLIFSTEPLWGTAFAVAVMGEQMGMNAAVGAGLILTACIYSNLGIDGLQDMWNSTKKNAIATFANKQ